MNEPLTERELKLLLAQVSHLVIKDNDFRVSIQSMVRANSDKLEAVKFNEEAELPY